MTVYLVTRPYHFQSSARYICQLKLIRWNRAEANKQSNNKFIKFYSTKGDISNKGQKWTFRQTLIRFAPVGLCLLAVMQWRQYRKLTTEYVKPAKDWQVKLYCSLPLRAWSKCFGWLSEQTVPVPLRPWVYGLYSSVSGCDLSEAANTDLKKYPTLGDFFVRELRSGIREIDHDSCLVSPCDGKILYCGSTDSCQIEQVKGITYSLQDFLGEITWTDCGQRSNNYYDNLLLKKNDKNTRLYHCVIYLAPGDYHRFHSPADWTPTHRRHFVGKLMSVNPAIANWLPGLFVLNERASYVGQWPHGFFSFTAVGATGVGKIRVYMDKSLQTDKQKCETCFDKSLKNQVTVCKGDPFGEFRLGSTVVLIFEAPADFIFSCKPGDQLRVGQSLGCVQSRYNINQQVYINDKDDKSRQL